MNKRSGHQHSPFSRIHIRSYLVLMNLIMFVLLLPTLSLYFWNKASQIKHDELSNSIETIRSSLKTRGASLLGGLSASANQAIASYDFSTLNLMVKQVSASDSDIRYCMVSDRQGMIVAHNVDALVGTPATDAFAKRVMELVDNRFPASSRDQPGNAPIQFLYQDDDPSNATMVVVTPVYSGTSLWGALRCGYSLQDIHQQIQHIESKWLDEKDRFTLAFVLIVSVFLLLGITVSLYFTYYFTDAVNELNSSVNEIAYGNLDTEIPAHRMPCLEFNSLANAINRMARNLQHSRKQLDEYSNSLEKLVAERTHKLEAANKELESFSYSVSHDLRAPLRSIDGFSRILQEDYQDKLDDEGVDYISRVRANVKHMEELIEGLLMLSRLTTAPLHHEDFDIGQYCRDLLEQIHKDEPERELQASIADDLIVHSDPSLLKIVMDNLVGNAWKYSAKKALTRIEIGKMKRGEDTVFYVRDNGAGFDMNHSDKLFGAFQRLHHQRDFGGSGIGLATVQRIINRLGGAIWARAEIDAGATFYFTLP